MQARPTTTRLRSGEPQVLSEGTLIAVDTAAVRSPLAPPTSQPPSVKTWNLSVQGDRFAWVYTAVINVGM